uniref:Cytochrome b5 heme-binding domain-containing protein n=1 Tax=Octactis speculum TaxID=3111310 RepID=A0A7S2GXG7_9STRA|mmetsp:Transcript_58995/g.80560  ORF Transcript_58995/g.80560 Transcript_58995/m.80560 type:complete len:246 (+) Transcript_58995:60-797(+)
MDVLESIKPFQRPNPTTPYPQGTKFSMAEVEKHHKLNDGWIVFNGKVYDITNFAKNHPGWIFGGQTSTALAIKRVLGTDCTEEISEIHPEHAIAQLELYRIGSLQTSPIGTGSAEKKIEHQETSIVVRLHAQSQGHLLDRGTCSFRLDPSQTKVGKLRRLVRIVLCARGYLGPTRDDPVPVNDRVKLIFSSRNSNEGNVVMSEDDSTLLSYGVRNVPQGISGKDLVSAHFFLMSDVALEPLHLVG